MRNRSKNLILQHTIGVASQRSTPALLLLGLIGTLTVSGCLGTSTLPHMQVHEPATPLSHLRAHELATGTRTPAAGEHFLDSLSGSVYVPAQCVGTRRCPLVIAAFHQEVPKRWHRQLADKYGIIFAEAARPNDEASMEAVDSIVKRVLPTFAIDPDRIALATEDLYQRFAAGQNIGDVFSRVAELWWSYIIKPISPQDTTTQFRIIGGVHEFNGMPVFTTVFSNAQVLRRTGYTVAYVGVLHDHANCVEDYEDMWQWFVDSWETPDPARRTRPHLTVENMPLLTDDAFSKMIDSQVIPRVHRYRKELAISVGGEQQIIMMPDLSVQVEHDSVTATKLKTIGLTAQQAEGYMAAFLTAISVGPLDSLGLVKVEPTSTVRRNIDFLKAHSVQKQALQERMMDCREHHG